MSDAHACRAPTIEEPLGRSRSRESRLALSPSRRARCPCCWSNVEISGADPLRLLHLERRVDAAVTDQRGDNGKQLAPVQEGEVMRGHVPKTE
jgi:hypothetical protein